MSRASARSRKKGRLTAAALALSAGERAISLITTVLASIMILYSGYVLYDNLYVQNNAFASNADYIDYKPEIIDDESAPLSGRTLASVNSDYRAWLTVYDTNIDYPVMQGEDDLYYASHDVYKRSSLTGAIYLAAANSPDFSDNYNLIYGHHMDNTAMFGGLDQYEDSAYFNAHKTAVLVTSDKVYDLTFFAALKTDAYDDMVYNVGTKDLDALKEYLAANGIRYNASDANDATKIIALSTCADAETSGRFVIFAVAVERKSSDTPVVPTDDDDDLDTAQTGDGTPFTAVIPAPATPTPGPTPGPNNQNQNPAPNNQNQNPAPNPDTAQNDTPAPADAETTPAPAAETEPAPAPTDDIEEDDTPLATFIKQFQPHGSSYGWDCWALVNLICMILTIYLCIPLLHLKAKFGRGKLMKKVNEEKEELKNNPTPTLMERLDLERIMDLIMTSRSKSKAFAPVTDEEFEDAVEEIWYHQKEFTRKFRIGIIIEVIISIIAVIAFILTEDIRLPMVLIDRWTPLMLIILLANWLVDLFLIRYRRKVEAEQEEDAEPASA